MYWLAGVTVRVKLPTGAVMTWVRVAVLEAKVGLAWKVAVMVCDPAARVVVERVATPVASRVCWPRTVVPSEKMTMPEGTPVVVVTVAVKVTFVPATTGEPEEARVVVVTAGAMAGVMVMVTGFLVALYLVR